MTVLWSVVAGGRPLTAQHALAAQRFVLERYLSDVEMHVVVWKDDVDTSGFPYVTHVPGAVKAEGLNASLADFMAKHDGELPEAWFTTDDDVVPDEKALSSLLRVLDWDPEVWLAGAWNTLAHRGRGTVRRLGHESSYIEVQYDDADVPSFAVGGALHAIPQAALEAFTADGQNVYDPAGLHKEDAHLTRRVREAGYRAVVVRTALVSLLPDDGVWEDYRRRVYRQYFLGHA